MNVRGDELARDLRLTDAVGIGFGAIIGAGIFVVTGVAAGGAGPALLAGLVIAGVVATANALSSAQLAAMWPRSGGTYEYGARALHPLAGFVAGWMFLASKLTAAGTVAIGLAGYLDPLLPGVHPRALAVGAIVLFTALNYFGIRRTSRWNLLIVLVSVGGLVLFAAVGARAFEPAHFSPFAPSGVRGVLESAGLLFFAYTGYARIATLGEEVHDPTKTIPRAIAITVGGALLLYAVVAVVAIGAVGAAPLAATSAPLRVAAEAAGGPWLATVISVAGVTAMLGVILSQLLGLSRMGFAMARGGDLPQFLAVVHPRHQVPARAVIGIGVVAAIIAATGTLAGIARIAALTILVYYAIANLSALRMPVSGRRYPSAVPWLGLVGCVVLALAVEWRTLLIGAIVLLFGLVLRRIVRATATSRSPDE